MLWGFTILLAALLGAAAWIDLRTRRLPDWLNAATFAAGLGAAWILGVPLIDALIGAAAGYLAIFAINQIYLRWRGRDGIGMGDAKLLGALGAWTGWIGLPFILLFASAAGIAFAIVTRRARMESIAFGPFIAAGGLMTWIVLRFFA